MSTPKPVTTPTTSFTTTSTSNTTDQRKYKIILAGDSSVGKTALFMKFLQGDSFDMTQTSVTTIDFNTRDIYLKEQRESVKLFIWDTAGQEKYRCIVSTYFKGCHGVLLVFDLTQQKSFQNLKSEWLPMLRRKAETATILLVGNKSDLEQKVDDQEVFKFARENQLVYVKTSAKSNSNVNQAFEKLTTMVNATRHSTERRQSFCIKRKLEDNKKKKNCCRLH